jgi:hypothetical protein
MTLSALQGLVWCDFASFAELWVFARTLPSQDQVSRKDAKFREARKALPARQHTALTGGIAFLSNQSPNEQENLQC